MAKSRLRSEQIYQAMVDDEAFALLPSLLADSVGARSCVIHWRDARHHAEIMAHSDYFSAEQMRNYAENFVDHDQWSISGSQRPYINRAWNTKDMVPASVYERGVFYNEWIRAMGDDTFHCIGTIMGTDRGLGLIGLHRGRCQTDFADDALKELDRNLIHLRRMLTVRARMAHQTMQIRGLSAMLDANPAPILAVTGRGRIVHANAAADALLVTGTLIREQNGLLHATTAAADQQLQIGLARAVDPAEPVASAIRIDAPGEGELELTLAPVRDGTGNMVLVTGRDPDGELRRALSPPGSGERLAPRELMVARLVGQGLRNRDIAARLGLTEGTVKVYLHQLFAKTGVTTRTELALRVGASATPPAR